MINQAQFYKLTGPLHHLHASTFPGSLKAEQLLAGGQALFLQVVIRTTEWPFLNFFYRLLGRFKAKSHCTTDENSKNL